MLTGKDGQLGRALAGVLLSSCRLVAVGRAELDISDRDAVTRAVGAIAPDVIVNAAAYTDVDGAEREAAQAMAVNRDGVGWLAEAARGRDAAILHVSTDFVFAGDGGAPYAEGAATAPINVYGASKLAGETVLAASGARHLILRTSWLFSEFPGNFVSRILALIQERESLSVVDDQIGTPTDAHFLAGVIAHLIGRSDVFASEHAILHVANNGQASRFELAQQVLTEVHRTGGRSKVREVRPIATAAYPLPARRPGDSRLSIARLRSDFGIDAPDWRISISSVLERSVRP